MKVKIIIVAVLTIAILILAFLLVKPSKVENSQDTNTSIKPEIDVSVTSEPKRFENRDFGVRFEYPGNYEVKMEQATNLYESDETMVFTFTDTTRPYVAQTKLSIYRFSTVKTIEELSNKLKVEYPDLTTQECKPKKLNSICVSLLTKRGEKQPPFHFVKQYDFGLTAITMDFLEKDTVLYDDLDQNGVSVDDP